MTPNSQKITDKREKRERERERVLWTMEEHTPRRLQRAKGFSKIQLEIIVLILFETLGHVKIPRVKQKGNL